MAIRNIFYIVFLNIFLGFLTRGYLTAPRFEVGVGQDGSYSLLINKAIWLVSGDTAFNVGGKTYSTADGSLKLTKVKPSNGTDKFGSWNSTSFLYQAGKVTVTTSISVYSTSRVTAAIFSQKYPSSGVTGTSAGDQDSIISRFPSFQLRESPNKVELGYLAYGGTMVGYKGLSFGRFDKKSKFVTGMEGGPLVIFDNSTNAIVISPLSKFMSASNAIVKEQISWGIMGMVDSVPNGYSVDFIVYYSNQGINQVMRDWGSYLTASYQKTSVTRNQDLTIQYLGYWTDNGAFYYYYTEQNKTYQDTIIDTVQYINSLDLPVKYLQFDSWWYLKGSHQGVKTWEPQSNIFPNGFLYLYERTQLPIGCHSKFWDNETIYARYNGGQYNFIPDPTSGLAFPDDSKFWDDLFGHTEYWGQFILYEQDWMDAETEENQVVVSDLSAGQRWLEQMGQSASDHNVAIQYCTSLCRHVLAALHLPAVTQARVSRDYQPGIHQWDIGVTSMLADVLNLAPYKDTFFSTGIQPGNHYNKSEPNTELQAVVSTLSTGPVGPGDGIGYINKDLIMRCCDNAGLILKPDKPATSIDDQIRRSAFGASYPGPAGEVVSTYSIISGYFFGIMLAANLSNEYFLTPDRAWPTIQLPESLCFSWNLPEIIAEFSNQSPIQLTSGCTAQKFCLFYTTPIITLGDGQKVALMGELDKWVHMSAQRFSSIETSGAELLVRLQVQARELVSVTFYLVNTNQLRSVICDNRQSSSPVQQAVVSLMAGTCTLV